MAAVQAGPSSTGCQARYLACKLYTNGTQTKSPTESMNPNPSLVISMVENIAGSLYKASKTYQAWKAITSHIESVIEPPRRTDCSQAMEMLIRYQRIIPGRSSLKDLMSRPKNVGLSSRPMNHWYRKFVSHVCAML